jgi:hypothetical protein
MHFRKSKIHPVQVDFEREITETCLTLAPLDVKGVLPLIYAATGEPEGTGVIATAYFERGPSLERATAIDPYHWMPLDFSVQREQTGQGLFWNYRLRGDYNGDGRVSGQDVFVLAKHFGSSVQPPDDDFSPAVPVCADGNGDWNIDGNDLFTIATFFKLELDGTRIYRSFNDGATFELLAYIPVEHSTLNSIACGIHGSYLDETDPFQTAVYRIVGVDAEGQESSTTAVVDDTEREVPLISLLGQTPGLHSVYEVADRMAVSIPPDVLGVDDPLSYGYI